MAMQGMRSNYVVIDEALYFDSNTECQECQQEVLLEEACCCVPTCCIDCCERLYPGICGH